MDPQASLDSARRALDNGNLSSALEFIVAYYNWRLAGGFAPAHADSTVQALAIELQDAMP